MDVPDNAVKITDPDTVKSLVVAQGHIQLIKRVCSSCVDSHKLIYYRRFTPMPASFDLYNNLMDDWFNTDNVLDVDFGLYSTYMDAIHDWDRWTFCNYNDPTVGFPRDCGPEGYVANNWNESHGSGRGQPDYAFFIMPPIKSGDIVMDGELAWTNLHQIIYFNIDMPMPSHKEQMSNNYHHHCIVLLYK